MHHVDPALLTIAWATAAGLLAQVLAHRWKIPAIVPLLLFGVALGPSGLGVIRPAALGSGLPVIVKLAVAVILFEGALSLRLRDLQRAMREVRNLVTIGVLVTWVGATLAAWGIAHLSFAVAVVFGALVTVTGPTVVQPLLRRVALPRRVKTVLEGEAILIDPIGAVLAVAVVDIVLGLTGARPIGVASGAWGYVGRLLVGAGVGAAGAFALSFLLKRRGLIPADLVNLVSLAAVWTVFGIAEGLQSEAGIMAAVVMGLVMQRGAVPEERRLRRFKEQLTVLGISLVFVLLAAALPLRVVVAEGWAGVATVAVLMFVVRPASAALSLRKSPLSWRERAFIAWIAPRGIVAASVASLFALALSDAGIAEGERVLAITFLTIAMTVTLQGLTAAPFSRLLGLHSLAGKGVVIVGAGPLALRLAQVLRERGRPVMMLDRNPYLVEHARSLGFDAIAGNALDENVLEDADVDEAETFVAVTTNAEVNALAAHLAHDAFGVARSYPALGHPSRGAGPRLLERVGGRIAFGRPIDVRAWDEALARGEADFVVYTVPAGADGDLRPAALPAEMIAMARHRGQSVEVTNAEQRWQGGDELILLSRFREQEAISALDAIIGSPAAPQS